jgi:hypothetical protein
MYVGWMNSSGGSEVISTKALGHTQPTRFGTKDIKVPALDVPVPSWTKISFSFSRRIDVNNHLSATTQYIYAYSSKKPKDIDDPNSKFHYHDSYGSFSQDFMLSTLISSDQPVIKSGSEIVFQMHGAVMYVAWGVLPFM